MNALLADPSAPEQPPSGSPSPSPDAPNGGANATGEAQPQVRECPHCGGPLQQGQRWCLRCGACEPGSLEARPPRRPLAVLALLTVLLAAGAAVAGAAALTRKPAPHRVVVALVPPPPVTTTPPTVGRSGSLGLGGTATGGAHTSAPGHSGNLLFPPSTTTKPPKLPPPVATPKSSGANEGSTAGEPSSGETTPTSTGEKHSPTNTSTTTKTAPKAKAESKTTEGAGAKPAPILLDTNAATTYNPSSYPASDFGDPALAIDGEPTTAWTAKVQPASFPDMAEGLLIDTREPTALGSAELETPTRGMVVQIYGANGAKAPTGITEPGWVLLSGSHTLKQKITHLRLRTGGKAFRFALVWVVKAPASARGTPAAPGQVALSEVVLYPPST